MRSDTIFSSTVHVEGPDLDLERRTVVRDQRGMQGLVHIGFGHGDIILETAGYRLIHFMDHAKGRIAVLYIVYDYPYCKQVIYLV